MLKIEIKNKRLLILLLVSFFSNLIFAKPFLGGFITSDSYFDVSASNNKFTTVDNLSFYLDQKPNDFIRFYMRITAGVKYFVDLPSTSVDLNNVSFMPSIDLFYLEVRSGRNKPEMMVQDNAMGETNFDLFFMRLGRILVTQSNGDFFSMKADGLDMFFTIKNFRLRLFGVTNSLNYLPMFDFIDGASSPIFTRWDRERMPQLNNITDTNSVNGFYSDPNNADFNYYFQTDSSGDYTTSEINTLNTLRKFATLSGRFFTGFSLELMQVFFQNFSINALVNIDLIPSEFVVTYPSENNHNVFGGKYTSVYLSFNANGKIWRGLYYNFEGVYETGYNAAYFNDGGKSGYNIIPIHSFAIITGISYYFNHRLKPTVSAKFYYANGDGAVSTENYVVYYENDKTNNPNADGYDNHFKAPSSPILGYVYQPDFSNLIVIELSNTIKPLNFLKNEIFSRFFLESVLLLYLKPIISGAAVLPENNTANLPFLGAEVDIFASWAVFSDFTAQFKFGLFFPNGDVGGVYSVNGKIGLSFTMSF